MARGAAFEVEPENAAGKAAILLVCEHASNHVPAEYGQLGLPDGDLILHSAIDVGALPLARRLAEALDAPLVTAQVSRLVIDPNRAHDAPDLIVTSAEGAPVPGNANLSAEDRADRIQRFHAPFHRAIEKLLNARPDIIAYVAVHTFTPSLFGKARPWHVGILHDDDTRLADVLIEDLSKDKSLVVGDNEPYAPTDGVYYTAIRHARSRGIAPVMIEVRNDLLRSDEGVAQWAERLSKALRIALAHVEAGSRGLDFKLVKRS